MINVYGSDGDDTFDLSGDTTQQFVVWSKGNDTVIGGLDIASNPNTFLVTESYALLAGNQGLTLNNSSGTMDITTSYGTSTYSNLEVIEGTSYNDIITGSTKSDDLRPGKGGNDVITGGAGSDNFNAIASTVSSVKITDYEAFEKIEFDNANSLFGFNNSNIKTAITTSTSNGGTHLSIGTNAITKNNIVELANGSFDISSIAVENNGSQAEVYLKTQNDSVTHYSVDFDNTKYYIKDYSEGAKIGFNVNFGVISQFINTSYNISYNQTTDQTHITVSGFAGTFSDLVLVDGEYAGSAGINNTSGELEIELDAQVGAVTDGNNSTNVVFDDDAIGAVVGITVSAIDKDTNDIVRYTLSDSADGRFAIDSVTGVVTVADPSKLDASVNSSHNITVLATSENVSSGTSTTSSKTFSISILKDMPVGPVTDANTGANQVSESAARNTLVGITASATDPDSWDTVSYALENDYNGAFKIDKMMS